MRTKIIATVGPASQSLDILRELVQAGVRVFRMNFSHADAESFAPAMDHLRRLERETGAPLTALADLSGPNLRIGDIHGSPLHIDKGARIMLGLPGCENQDSQECAACMTLDKPSLLFGLEPGTTVSLSDGMLEFEVSQVLRPDELYELRALNPGILSSHKGITFPGRALPLRAMTDKDRKDLRQALDIGIGACAMSFVQSADDIKDVQEELRSAGRRIPVIAKLERRQSVDNLEAILVLADAVMVARGDLGLECSLMDLPILQKQIIAACRRAEKPVIVATQMLSSMVENPLPTRSETTDVANAVLDGADCLMLSEETAVGRDPVKAVRYMRGIAERAEAFQLQRQDGPLAPSLDDPERTLAYCACLLAEQSGSEAIVCHTRSGITARHISGRRPAQTIHALTPEPDVLNLLNMCWSAQPRLVSRKIESHLERCQSYVAGSDEFQYGRNVVITSGQKTPGRGDLHTNEVKIYCK